MPIKYNPYNWEIRPYKMSKKRKVINDMFYDHYNPEEDYEFMKKFVALRSLLEYEFD